VGDERRAGYDDFASLLKESTRDIMSVVDAKMESTNTQLREHSADASKRLAEVSESVALNRQAVSAVSDMVKPLPEKIAAIQQDLHNMKSENKTQWGYITSAKKEIRDLEVKVAEKVVAVKPEKVAGTSWYNNARVQVILAGAFFVFIAGLLMLAGADLKSLPALMK